MAPELVPDVVALVVLRRTLEALPDDVKLNTNAFLGTLDARVG